MQQFSKMTHTLLWYYLILLPIGTADHRNFNAALDALTIIIIVV
jgi:hypothetical protein